jgi:hypothetical protein
MTNRSPLICSPYAFIWEVIQKTHLFKSFTGLAVLEFDDIYNKKIAKNMLV